MKTSECVVAVAAVIKNSDEMKKPRAFSRRGHPGLLNSSVLKRFDPPIPGEKALTQVTPSWESNLRSQQEDPMTVAKLTQNGTCAGYHDHR
jgi:hypothetical protein